MNLSLWLRVAGYSILVLMLATAVWVNHELELLGKDCNERTLFVRCP